MSQAGTVALALAGVAAALLVPVTAGYWFLAVIVRVRHRGEGLGRGWRWLTIICAAQWAGLGLFELLAWLWGVPFVAYLAAMVSFSAALALILFARYFPSEPPFSRQTLFATYAALALTAPAVLLLGILLVSGSLYRLRP